MNTIEEFYNDFQQQIYAFSDVSEDFKAVQFFEKAMEYLIDDGIVEDYSYLPFIKKSMGMKIDGYDFIADRGILSLFICEYEDDLELKNLLQSEIDASVRKVIKFFSQSISKQLFKDLEETSPGHAISHFLYHNQDKFTDINIVIISNKKLSQRVKSLPTEQIDGYKVTYDIWDINRLYDIETSKNKKESLEIDFTEDFNTKIPALPAHIEKSPYHSYLCVVNGNILANLYEKYGARLLESNVRSFLQFRGKINKGIRKTINEDPSMFFAYNNGITATAEYIELDENNLITRLKNFQIVNGGQTTASLFNTRKIDKVPLDDIFVQMKLTIIDDDKVNEVVPNISKFANTQNKVSDSDFFSNDVYHIRIEEKSRRIWAPIKSGELKGTKWFYERAKGQYLEVQSKLTDAQKKEFKATNPKSQMFTKTDLAKYMMVWKNLPHIVSLGAQKNFDKFGEIIVPKWNKNDKEFNDVYYQHAIAKAIIFKECDSIVYSQPWYGGYKANIVAYTLSTISYLLGKEKKNINFSQIWKNQEINQIFKDEIIAISQYVNSYITNTPENFTNVSEWCKRELCWTKLKDILNHTNDLTLSEQFIESLLEDDELTYELKEAKKEQKIENEMERLKKLYQIQPNTWSEIIQFGKENNLISQSESMLLNLIPSGKSPSDSQSKKIIQTIDRLQEEGMASVL